MTLANVIAFVLGMVSGIPGSYFAIGWWQARKLQPVTPLRRQLLAEVRRALDETRRDLEDVSTPAASALCLRIKVLRAADEDLVLTSLQGAGRYAGELAALFGAIASKAAFHRALETAGLAAFNAYTIALTFQLCRGGES